MLVVVSRLCAVSAVRNLDSVADPDGHEAEGRVPEPILLEGDAGGLARTHWASLSLVGCRLWRALAHTPRHLLVRAVAEVVSPARAVVVRHRIPTPIVASLEASKRITLDSAHEEADRRVRLLIADHNLVLPIPVSVDYSTVRNLVCHSTPPPKVCCALPHVVPLKILLPEPSCLLGLSDRPGIIFATKKSVVEVVQHVHIEFSLQLFQLRVANLYCWCNQILPAIARNEIVDQALPLRCFIREPGLLILV
mmetsp:Transcript_43648/g.102631  ORF Transcript_43648/g.102631 Transcript_43648/m.102631 type:complete len:251 (-) Transcript_43648:495-1247(-)